MQLGDNERGVIVGPRLEARPGLLSISGRGLDRQELRIWTLLFDQILYPRLPIDIALGDDDKLLVAEGVMRRGRSSGIFLGGDLGEAVGTTYREVFEDCERRDAGKWSLASLIDSATVGDTEEEPRSAILYRLHKAIPVPGVDVPIPEILEFKQRRRNELTALRAELETRCSAIASDPDQFRAEERESARLQIAVNDYLAAAREWPVHLRLGSLSIKAKVEKSLNFGSIAVAHEVASYFSTDLAPLAGAAAAFISLQVGYRRANRGPHPYEYLAGVERDLWRDR